MFVKFDVEYRFLVGSFECLDYFFGWEFLNDYVWVWIVWYDDVFFGVRVKL